MAYGLGQQNDAGDLTHPKRAVISPPIHDSSISAYVQQYAEHHTQRQRMTAVDNRFRTPLLTLETSGCFPRGIGTRLDPWQPPGVSRRGKQRKAGGRVQEKQASSRVRPHLAVVACFTKPRVSQSKCIQHPTWSLEEDLPREWHVPHGMFVVSGLP